MVKNTLTKLGNFIDHENSRSLCPATAFLSSRREKENRFVAKVFTRKTPTNKANERE